VEDGKLTALTFDDVLELGRDFDRVLIEADGSRGLPLKYPAGHEPVIPPFSDQVAVVAGLDGLGGRIAETVFRWELFAGASGIDGGAVVTPRVVERLFAGDGVFKGVGRDRATVILNKYDVCTERSEALGTARALLAATNVGRVVVSSLRFGIFYGVEAVGGPSATGIQLA
jgi:probable selenium-dependent hydroxylase accessory protein YqeC